MALVDYGDEEWLALAEKLMAERDVWRNLCISNEISEFESTITTKQMITDRLDAEAARIMEKESK